MDHFKIFQKKLIELGNDITEIERHFLAFSKQLMNEYVLVIDDIHYELTEIEYYYQSHEHYDTYLHGKEQQKKFRTLYVHTKGRGGFDLTFGNGDFYGGILIRGIKSKELFITGQIRLKKHILKNIGDTLLSKYDSFQEYFDKNKFPIVPKEKEDISTHKVFHSTRIGLTNKDKDEKKEKFQDAFYRFIREDYLNGKCEKGGIPQKTKVQSICHLMTSGFNIDTKDYNDGTPGAIKKVENDKRINDKIIEYNNIF